MPRRKIDPSVPVFDFQLNPEKELAARTLDNYKNYLNRISELSYVAHQSNPSIKIIKDKADLLANAHQVVKLIKEFTDKRITLCGLYSAIFYALGHQDYQKDSRGKHYLDEFRKVYYDKDYQDYLIKNTKQN